MKPRNIQVHLVLVTDYFYNLPPCEMAKPCVTNNNICKLVNRCVISLNCQNWLVPDLSVSACWICQESGFFSIDKAIIMHTYPMGFYISIIIIIIIIFIIIAFVVVDGSGGKNSCRKWNLNRNIIFTDIYINLATRLQVSSLWVRLALCFSFVVLLMSLEVVHLRINIIAFLVWIGTY